MKVLPGTRGTALFRRRETFVCFAPPIISRCQQRQSLRPARAGKDEETVIEDKGKASKDDLQAAQSSGTEIYIGFDKSDTEPRKGRKGRVVTGNVEDYPERNDYTGGWAGGEKGLQQFLKKYEEEEKARKLETQSAKVVETKEVDGKVEAKAITKDGEQIYIGYGKSEKRTGQPGSFITDDPRRYPDKEDVGFIPSITGGFAGGEKGVQQFAKTGDVKFAESRTGEFSPVLLAAIVALGVSTGALLLNSGIVLTESAFEPSLPGSGADESQLSLPGFGKIPDNKVIISQDTKKLLNVALGIIGVSTLILGGRTISKRLQKSSVQLKEDAVNVGKLSVFWITVMIGILYVVNY